MTSGVGGSEFGQLPPERRTEVLDRLAGEASAGDERALAELLDLVDRHRLARPAVRALIVDDADADDVAQDVLIKLAIGIGSFRGDARFTTWLNVVARNCAIGHLRRRRPEVATDPADLAPKEWISSLIASRRDLTEAIDRLPEHYRTVVVLRDVDGLPYQTIADRVGVELGTVRSTAI